MGGKTCMHGVWELCARPMCIAGERQKGPGHVYQEQPGALWSERKGFLMTVPGAHSAMFSSVHNLFELC